MTSCLDSHSPMEHKPERLSAVSTGNRIQHDVKVYVALFKHTCTEKTIFLGKDNLTIMIVHHSF